MAGLSLRALVSPFLQPEERDYRYFSALEEAFQEKAAKKSKKK